MERSVVGKRLLHEENEFRTVKQLVRFGKFQFRKTSIVANATLADIGLIRHD
jgi:hypothetical protein